MKRWAVILGSAALYARAANRQRTTEETLWTARGALVKYGAHRVGCDRASSYSSKARCSCGLDQKLAMLGIRP